jgi:hypothetical protein
MSLGSHGPGRSGTWRALSIMRRAISIDRRVVLIGHGN